MNEESEEEIITVISGQTTDKDRALRLGCFDWMSGGSRSTRLREISFDCTWKGSTKEQLKSEGRRLSGRILWNSCLLD